MDSAGHFQAHGSGAKTPRDLDTMDFEKYARSVIALNPSMPMVEELFSRAAPLIAGISTLDCVKRIYLHNPECVTVFAKHDPTGFNEPVPEGFVAMLPLTADGYQALFDGRLETNAPDVGYICRQSEKPAAIYIWAIYTPPRLSGGVSLIMERLSSRKYRDAPIFCKAASQEAEDFFLTLGFSKGSTQFGHYKPEVLHYHRRVSNFTHRATEVVKAPRPIYDSFDPAAASGNSIGIKAVHTVDELQKVFAIRAVSYIGEQRIPYDEDVDGNDLSGTHLIGYVGLEPAGCVRIRYFSDFVKIERLAVLPKFRRTRLSFKLIEAAIGFCRAKGYTRFYGQAEDAVVPLWRHFGFQPRNGDPLSYMTDRSYREGDLFIEPAPDALTPNSGGYVLIRREGEWGREGVFELKN